MDSQVPRTVVIDCFAENVERYKDVCAIVAIDVIRATTTAVTAVAMGRKCFPVSTVESGLALAARLDHPLMVGEQGGDLPDGYEIANSPAQIAQEDELHRPIVLLSSSGTRILTAAMGSAACYVACLRNFTAQLEHLIKHHPQVALIGAGTRGEFREEDQLCCAWIARGLLQAGYTPANEQTAEIIERWRSAPVEAFLVSNSVAYLRRSGQLRDLDFILAHLDDLPSVFELRGDEVVMLPGEPSLHKPAGGYLEPKTLEPQLNANI
ncbi:MAG: 2-phosphosulfolactate phosphatase [Acidobacteriia bacterium]|nr:2-phosphosulfolactate phosphatase [Terriglobia bacterium]